jgi:MFS family permease
MSSHGRKGPCICASIIVIIGWGLLLSTGRSYRILGFVARFVMGIGAGAVSTVTPVYIAELSPVEYRGAYGVMSQLATSTAGMLIYLMGIWLSWRTIAGLSLIAPGVLLLLIYWIPESPIVSRCSSGESLVQKRFIKPFAVSALLVIFQQFSGINALLTNLNPIFRMSNVHLKASICSTIVSAAQVVTTAISTPLVENLGRKLTWIISSVGQALFLLLLWANELWSFSAVLPVVCLFFDVLAFGIGLGPLPWFVVPELFPDAVRSSAMGVIQAVNWGLAALMIFVFESMQKSMTLAWVYFFYGMVMAVSLVFGILVLPETRGREMGDLDEPQTPQAPRKYSSKQTLVTDD